MTNGDERMKILKMLEEGKIKADEAARLLEAVGAGAAVAEGSAGVAGGKGKTLQIRVFRADGERARVNVNIPLSLAKWALKLAGPHAHAHVGAKEIDLDEVASFLEQGPGDVITVVDDEKGERVEISVK